MKHITYNHTSHIKAYTKNGAILQEILSTFIISLIFNIKVIYHETWHECLFITKNSFNKHTVKPLDKYDYIINITEYLKWDSISFSDLMNIKKRIEEAKENTLIILNNVCLINPSYLYKWYKQKLLVKNYYNELFLPKLRDLYFYERNNKEIEQFYIHIRNGDIGKRHYDEGLNLEYYTYIIKLINSISNIKINIMYEGENKKKTTLEHKHCYTTNRLGYNHLWVRKLGDLPNVILNEGDLDNVKQHINELCRAKYILLSPSTFSYYSGMISNGLKFIDIKSINRYQNILKNTIDLPNFIVYDDFKNVLNYLNA